METGQLFASEIALGIVAPVGTNTDVVVTGLKDRLAAFKYGFNEV